MAKGLFKGSFGDGKYNINISLSIYFWKEDDICFSYSPALDITGYGDDEFKARDSFEITLSEFLSYTHNKKTIYDELENLGWTVNRKKKRVHAPGLEEILDDNSSFKEIFNKGKVRRESKNVEFALA